MSSINLACSKSFKCFEIAILRESEINVLKTMLPNLFPFCACLYFFG